MDVKNNEFEKALDVFLKQRTKTSENLPNTPHFDEDMLNALFESQLSEREKTFFAKHLVDCGACRRITADFARTAFDFEEETVSEKVLPASTNGILSRLAERFFSISDNAVLAHQSEEPAKDETEKHES